MMLQLAQISFFLTIPLLLVLVTVCCLYKKEEDEHVCRAFIYSLVSLIFILNTLSFMVLVQAHVLCDYSVTNVATNSHSTQPMIYNIIGLWGNHEGSMLLWQWILSVYTYSIIYARRIPINILRKTLMVQSILNIYFILYIYITSNPYIQIPFNRLIEGVELNPILQDIVLSIHPPLVYAGYIGLSIPMSITIGYLTQGHLHFGIWLYYIKLYNTISWLFLTVGIFLGSWWAYYELGWGGWWFWDPVENASLMPWILSTALMHSIIAAKKTGTHTKWTIVLSLFSFYSSVIGTFFVRSGFLDSVHSFSSDNNRGYFILALLVVLLIYIGYTYHKYSKHTDNKELTSIISNDGLILINQLFFACFYVVVAIGTFYPIIHNLFFSTSITIGPSFYNQILVPIAIPSVVLMCIATYLRWQGNLVFQFYNKDSAILLHTYIGIMLSTTLSLYMLDYNGPIILYLCLPILLWAFFSILKSIMSKNSTHNSTAAIAHLGVVVLVSSIALWYCFQKEKHFILSTGDKIRLGDYVYMLQGVNIIKGPNYDASYGSFIVTKKNVIVGMLFPEKRYYSVQDFYASKVDIQSSMLNDIHIMIGDGSIFTGWEISLYIYLFMPFLWISAFIFIIAAIMSVKDCITNNK